MEGYYHLRIHTKELGDLTKFCNFLTQRNVVALIVKEYGKEKKEHLHIYVKPNKTKSTMIQQIVKEYPGIKGNGSYSCRAVIETPENFVKYCCKGENADTLPNVLVNSGYDVDELHKQFWLTNKTLKQSSGVNMGCQNDPPKKVKALSWTEKVYQQIQNDYENEVYVIQQHQRDPKSVDILDYNNARRTIFRHMMKCFGKSVKKINATIIQDHYNGFINSIAQADEVAGEKYSDRLFDSLILNK